MILVAVVLLLVVIGSLWVHKAIIQKVGELIEDIFLSVGAVWLAGWSWGLIKTEH